MQLTENKLKKNSQWSLWVCACSVFVLSHVAEGAPKFLGVIENGVVEATYQHERQFSFSREENNIIIKKILERLPLAQSASIVSSSKQLPTSENNQMESLGYKSVNFKQVHMVSVSFSRSDLIPPLYFQVKEDWKDCDGNPSYCQEELTLNITGPSRIVRDLSDYGAFPKTLNVLQVDVKLANSSGSSFRSAAPAKVTWTFDSTRGIQNGIEQYVRYFRSKASVNEEKIELRNLSASMSLWASQVSKSAFKDL